MQIAILLFPGVTALDAIGPYEVLSRIPHAQVIFVALEPGPVKTANQMCTLVADFSLNEVLKPHVIIIPGGPGTDQLMEDPTILKWIIEGHDNPQWMASVCTGSLLLASAGLLQNKEATSHWSVIDQLSSFGTSVPLERFLQRSAW